MEELMRMQKCFSRYPKLYNHKVSEEENKIESNNVKLMNHPEARRYRMNESRKQNQH